MTSKNGTSSFFVIQTNPEIFQVIPRPGGLAKIDIPIKPDLLKENAAKAQREASGTSNLRRSRSSKTKAKFSPPSRSASETPRKSLLTINTLASEGPQDIDADHCPREYKVKQIIAATPWSVEFDEYLEPTEESRRIPDPFQDSVDMLAMSISVIMLLSRDYGNISSTHFKWVFSYLECIRDEFDQLPPNIQGILNHIKEVTGGQISSYLDDDSDVLKPTTIQIVEDPPAEADPDPES